LPSIELKYRYPGSEDDRELMRKLEVQERACVAAADRIVTPSAVTRDFLVSARGALREKIVVIPNGADTRLFGFARTRERDAFQLLYFGTLSSWQGVEVAIRAVAQIDGAFLTVLGSGSGARRNALAHLAAKLGATNRISISPPVSQQDLAVELADCDAVLAPLLWNDRNVLQGCCPLKVLEGMAGMRPVIASDLPVVRELAAHEEHLLLADPGSVDSLVAAILRLRDDSELSARLAANGRRLVEKRYTWAHAVASLVDVYRDIRVATSTPTVARAPVRS
jgi:glycosyltransferase involved in cell wall biosynthesis